MLGNGKWQFKNEMAATGRDSDSYGDGFAGAALGMIFIAKASSQAR